MSKFCCNGVLDRNKISKDTIYINCPIRFSCKKYKKHLESIQKGGLDIYIESEYNDTNCKNYEL